MSFVAAIETIISRENAKQLEEFLTKMGIERLPVEKGNKMFVYFINVCHRLDKPNSLKVILDAYNELSYWPPSSDFCLFTKVLFIDDISDKTLKWILETIDNATFAEVIQDLIGYIKTDEVYNYTVKAIDLFNVNEYDFAMLEELIDTAKDEESGNLFVYKALSRFYNNLIAPADIPSWVVSIVPEQEQGEPGEPGEPDVVFSGAGSERTREIPEDKTIPTRDDVILPESDFSHIELPTQDDFIPFIVNNITSMTPKDIFNEEALTMFVKSLESKTNEELEEIIRPMLINDSARLLGDDEEYFQMYGPANAIIGMQLGGEYICSKLGGCRMMTCNCFTKDDQNVDDEAFDDTDTDINYINSNIKIDWFINYCQQCGIRIRRRTHAIRKPLPYGGWSGCYCSSKCIKDSFDTNGETLDTFNEAIIDTTVQKLNEIGIADLRD